MYEYDVFLSHNSADRVAVGELARRLREAGLNPFLDRWHLIPGQPWMEALEEALEQSATVAVFVGPSGVSPWHNEEMRTALDQAVRTRDEVRVIPVLLPGAKREAVARFLARRTWVDFGGGLDDAEALARLVAGVKGEAISAGTYELPDEPAPYRGLLHFDAEHARFFFGRDADLDRLVEKLDQSAFVALVGASGSGKSSLLHAGLLPALAKDALPGSKNWEILVLTPGRHPLRALGEQLATLVPPADRLRLVDELVERCAARSDGLRTAATALMADDARSLLLVVDQFEELFTLCQGSAEQCRARAEQFIANLYDAVHAVQGLVPVGNRRIRVLIALRADFLDRCLAFPTLQELLQDRQVLLGALSESSLREAVVRPAGEVGAFYEKGLVRIILDEVGAQPGALPLLQHALYELWRARRGPWLTLEAYEASGGVSGALQRRAQATYGALTPGQQQIARNVFLRLTALGEGVSDTRRRVSRAELYPAAAEPQQVDVVLQALSGPGARLIVAREGTVEVAHEALIQEWPTLREWLEQDRAALRTHRRLTEAAGEWEQNERDESYLYVGARLAEAEEWAETHAEALNPLERAFLKASVALRDRQARKELEQARRLAEEQRARAEERTLAAVRQTRRARWLAGALILAILSALGAGWFWRQAVDHAARAAAETTRAVEAGSTAEAERAVALSHQLAVQAFSHQGDRPDLALLLSLEGIRIADTIEAGDSLREGLERCSPNLTSILGYHPGDHLQSLAFSPDGKTLATGGGDGSILLWDVATRQPIGHQLAGHTDKGGFGADIDRPVYGLAFSPDGAMLASGGCGFDGLDSSGRVIRCISGEILLWDVETRQTVGPPLTGHTSAVSSVAFSSDGDILASGSGSGTIILWDVRTGQPICEPLYGHTGPVLKVTFSPDGRVLASGGQDAAIVLWDVDSGQPLGAPLAGHTDSVWGLAFSPDGKTLASGSWDETVILWDVASRRPLGDPLTDHTDSVYSVAFSPDGKTLASSSWDKTILLWDVATRKRIGRPLTGHTDGVVRVAYSPDGKALASGGSDGAVLLWNAGAHRTLVGHEDAVSEAAFGMDGQTLVSGSSDGTVLLWDVASRQPLAEMRIDSEPTSLALSPDDAILAAGHRDKSIVLWDAATGGLRSRLPIRHRTYVDSLAFSPDSKVLASGASGIEERANGQIMIGPGKILLWDVETGQPIGDVLAELNPGIGALSFSPDGQTLASANADNVTLWDLGTRQPISPSTALHLEEGRSVQSLAFSPDGQTLLAGLGEAYEAGEQDAVVALWDVERGDIHTERLTGHTGDVESVAFGPGDQILALGSRGDTLLLWTLHPELQQARACRIANRDLTPEEWAHYVGSEEYRSTCSSWLPERPALGRGEPRLSFGPPAGPVGTRHRGRLSSFRPGEKVTLEYVLESTGTTVYSATTTVDEAGSGIFTLSTEPGDAAGRYLVLATGEAGSTAQSTLDIVSSEPRLAIEPSHGPVGTVYTIALLYFQPDQVVDLEFVFAETDQVIHRDALEMDSLGAGAYYASSEPGDAEGLYLVRAIGQGGSIAQGQFRIGEE